jgi:hypothetical protein
MDYHVKWTLQMHGMTDFVPHGNRGQMNDNSGGNGNGSSKQGTINPNQLHPTIQ